MVSKEEEEELLVVEEVVDGYALEETGEELVELNILEWDCRNESTADVREEGEKELENELFINSFL